MGEYVHKTLKEMEYDSYERAEVENLSVEQLPDMACLVINFDKNTRYIVEIKEGRVVYCNCPHHTYRGAICKHMVRVGVERNIPIE